MEMLVHENALLALAAAVLWGGGDFSGGMGVKQAGGSMGAALRVILLSHCMSFCVLVLAARMRGMPSASNPISTGPVRLGMRACCDRGAQASSR